MTNRSALVTGASGFIGRSLAMRLVAEGWTVTTLGRKNPCVAGARFIPIPFLDAATLLTAVSGQRFDVVFHLAAYGVAPGDRDPALAFDVNVSGTAAVVRAAGATGASTVVYAGSCSEYAEACSGSLIAETHPLTTRGLYGPSKAAGGLWGQALARHLGITFIWMRLFGVYGPGEAAHRLMPSIVAGLRRQNPVDLSPGDQIRDLIHIDDAVEGLLQAEYAGGVGSVGIFNLCSGQPASVKAVALAIADALGKPRDLLRFGAIPVRLNETMWLVGDGAAFAEAVNFLPRLSLETGLARAVAQLDDRTNMKNRPCIN